MSTINKGKALLDQVLRVDYIQPKNWYSKPNYRIVLPIYFRDFVIPEGFVTDMGTIPRSLWFIFDPINRYGHAVVVHDYALGIMTRRSADRRFREALREVGVKEWRVQCLYHAVLYYGIIVGYLKNPS